MKALVKFRKSLGNFERFLYHVLTKPALDEKLCMFFLMKTVQPQESLPRMLIRTK